MEHVFSADFVFRGPMKGQGKEVTDVLVVIRDVALVVQVKARSDPNPSRSWLRKNLKKAVRQVRGGARTIREKRLECVENRRAGRIPFPYDEVKWIYGLAVLDCEAEPEHPRSLYPGAGDTDVPLHVLTLADLRQLCIRLSTPWDLVNYLESRTDVLIPTLDPRIADERPVFEYYLENLEEIVAHRAKSRGEQTDLEATRVYADAMRRIATGSHPDYKFGDVIDDIINKAHTATPEDSAMPGKSKTEESVRDGYRIVATELGGISRCRRMALGKEYIRIAEEARDANEMRFHASHSPLRGDCTLLIASPLARDQRAERKQELAAMLRLLKEHHQVKRGIGIATEEAGRMGSSYDMIVDERELVGGAEVAELGREMFGSIAGPLVK